MIPSFYSLEQCDRVTLENNTMPYVKSYFSCLNRVIGDGYSEEFEFSAKGGFRLLKTGREYSKDECKILNMFRFEGSENAGDNVLMYMLETVDGLKGTLITTGLNEQNETAFANVVN